MSEAIRFAHPYIFYLTYRFHVEKAREAGKLIKRFSGNPWIPEGQIMTT